MDTKGYKIMNIQNTGNERILDDDMPRKEIIGYNPTNKTIIRKKEKMTFGKAILCGSLIFISVILLVLTFFTALSFQNKLAYSTQNLFGIIVYDDITYKDEVDLKIGDKVVFFVEDSSPREQGFRLFDTMPENIKKLAGNKIDAGIVVSTSGSDVISLNTGDTIPISNVIGQKYSSSFAFLVEFLGSWVAIVVIVLLTGLLVYGIIFLKMSNRRKLKRTMMIEAKVQAEFDKLQNELASVGNELEFEDEEQSFDYDFDDTVVSRPSDSLILKDERHFDFEEEKKPLSGEDRKEEYKKDVSIRGIDKIIQKQAEEEKLVSIKMKKDLIELFEHKRQINRQNSQDVQFRDDIDLDT